jgi:hypothetical protein
VANDILLAFGAQLVVALYQHLRLRAPQRFLYFSGHQVPLDLIRSCRCVLYTVSVVPGGSLPSSEMGGLL